MLTLTFGLIVGLVCLVLSVVVGIVMLFVGLPLALLMGFLPWLLRAAGVVLVIKGLLDRPFRWENLMPAVVAFVLAAVVGWVF